MRLISVNGDIDIPYEHSVIFKKYFNKEYCVYAKIVGCTDEFLLGGYRDPDYCNELISALHKKYAEGDVAFVFPSYGKPLPRFN